MFEKFCSENKIKGNYKEAFYHYLMAKYSNLANPAQAIDNLDLQDYKDAWVELLKEIVSKF